MSGLFISQPFSHFRFGQTWSETKTLQIILESFYVHSPARASSTSPREALLACPSSPAWNLPSFLHCGVQPFLFMLPALVLLSLAHLDSLPPYNLMLWTDSSVPFPFGKGGSGVLANCSLCGTETTLSFSAGPVCSSFSAETCATLHALCWSRQHFSSPTN